MKKLLILLLVMAAIICAFASCGDDEEGGGTAPTAPPPVNTTPSSNPNACPKGGEHSIEFEETEPTCSTPGTYKGVCSKCGFVKEETEGKPAVGHNGKTFVTEVVKAPTCTEKGTQRLICSDCGEPQWSKDFKAEIPELGHSYLRGGILFTEEAGVKLVAPKCGADGYFERICTDCAYNEDPLTREEYKELEGKPGYDAEIYASMEGWEHKFAEEPDSIIPATCTEPMYKVFKCTECDETKQEADGEEAGHRYYINEEKVEGVDYVIDPKPTCITEGKRIALCAVCHERTEDNAYIEAVPMLEHDTSKRDDIYRVTTVPANCTDKAYEIYRCCNGACGITEKVETTDALGHDWQKSGEPSCATGGLTPHKCARPGCKETLNIKDEDSIENLKHTKAGVVSKPTCVSDAVYLCSVCGNTYGPSEGEEGFAHGRHKLVFDHEVAPTCNEVGYKVYKCNGDPKCTVQGKNDDVNNLNTPKAEDVKPRLSHRFVLENGFVALSADGRIKCETCSLEYRDVTTEEQGASKSLCIGTCEDECTCGLILEWIAYISPEAATVIEANKETTFDHVKWEELGQDNVPLEIGNGAIVLEGGDETEYTVKIYDKAGGELLFTFDNLSGSKVYIDLYEYAEVGQVVITSTTKALVRLCKLAY